MNIKKQYIKAILCLIALTHTPLSAVELFVATDGIDNIAVNDGSISKPWASLNFALDQVAAGDSINMREGRYYETISKTHISGTLDQPITIQSYNHEQVTFDGTIPLTGRWIKHEGSIYKLKLEQPIWQLFRDNEMMMNARWPNARFDDGSVYTRGIWAKALDDTTTNGHIYTDPSVHDLAGTNIDATGAVVIANNRQFDSYTRNVTSHSAGQGAFEHDATSNFMSKHIYYYLQGALSLLDQDKEWHIDTTTNTVYFWDPSGDIPTGTFRGRNQQLVIDANNWNYVTFKNLDFFATTLELKSSESITIEDCNFNYAGSSLRALGKTDKAAMLRLVNNDNAGNFFLRNISITNSDSQAFYIKGENTVVENSLFENIDWASTEADQPSATLVFQGNNALLSRNTIRNTGTSETVASANDGRLTVEYNDISNTGYAQTDGAIIQIRIDPQDGTEIHHNWLHDTPKYGIRFDAPNPAEFWADNGFTHHNVIWNSNGHIPKGTNGRHFNNLLFDNAAIDLIILHQQADDGVWSNESTQTINNAADTISGQRNFIEPIPDTSGSNFDGNSEDKSLKSLLIDVINRDFRPVGDSSLVDAGDVISDPSYNHPTLGSAPDLGAYESGDASYWIPGRKLPKSSHPIPAHTGKTTRTNTELMWREGYTATSHNVYFGTSSLSLDLPSAFKGNQSNNIFSPDALTVGQTYYWRIDAVTPKGIVKGEEWTFIVDATPQFKVLSPVADAYVDDTNPDMNFGDDARIKLTTPLAPGEDYEQQYGFLQFDLNVPGTVRSAMLRLYNGASSENRFVNVHTVKDNSWLENLITWNNQPLMGASLQELDILSTTWAEFDVLAAIEGKGKLSLGLKRGPLNSRRQVASKESSFGPELIIEYQPVEANLAPSFTDNILSLTQAVENKAYSLSIAAYASDPENDALAFNKLSGPSWLQVTSNGNLSGTPLLSDVGDNSFVIEVQDSHGVVSAAMLSISVAASPIDIENLAPSFSQDTLALEDTNQNEAYSISITSYASDPENDALSFSKVSGPDWITVNIEGMISGTPTASDGGSQILTVKVSALGGEDTMVINFTVQAASEPSPETPETPAVVVPASSGGGALTYSLLLLLSILLYRRKV